MTGMHITYDGTVNAASVQLRRENESIRSVRTVELGNVLVDLGPEGDVVQVEFLDVEKPTVRHYGVDETDEDE